MLRSLLVLLLLALAWVPSASASVAEQPWPPTTGPGNLFIHYGEEHWNDDDGLTLLPKIVEETARYRPAMVTMSGDKANDGVVEELSRWEQIMAPYDAAGIPYYAGVGNHDRDSFSEGGLPPPGPLDAYKEVYRDRPYPFGDAQPKADPQLSPQQRPAGDPEGAASHYFVDYGNVRWVFIDNSCFVIDECDMFQEPSAQTQEGEGQFAFLQRVGEEAGAQGKLTYVVMHMPTRDPRDQSYIDPTTFNHVMGKGATTDDNEKFEQVAQAAGVDGVFLGHIKGQFTYRGQGGVPYHVDGGAGGELYTEGPVGTDHGYWHGFRLLRVDGNRLTTDTVPIFVADGIRLEGSESVKSGEQARYIGLGRQPVFNDPAKVEALELRDPDPQRPVDSGGPLAAGVGSFVRGGGWVLAPILLLLLGGVAMNATGGAAAGRRRPRRRLRPRVVVGACAGAGALVIGTATMSIAQQEAPTTTPLDSLPSPARIYATSDPQIIAPIASGDDDPRRDPRTQTEDGLFEGACPGSARISVTSGFETTSVPVAVRSPKRVTKIVRRARVLPARGLRAGRRRTVARVVLGQRARVRVVVRRNGKTLATLRDDCLAPGSRALRVAWGGRVRRDGRLRSVRPGRVQVRVLVRSDRAPVRRSGFVRVLGRRGGR